MQPKCKVCSKEVAPDTDFCGLHQKAFENLNNGYSIWRLAYSDKITFADYLEALTKRPETGKAVQEIAHHLIVNQKSGD